MHYSAPGCTKTYSRQYIHQGTPVVIADVNEERARGTATDLSEQYDASAVAVHCDVTDAESVQSMIDGAIDHFEEIGMLVNNTGRHRSLERGRCPSRSGGER